MASVIGALEARAGGAYAAAFGAGAPAAALPAPPSPRPPLRFAWCSTFDTAAGAGRLIDLENRSEFAVRRADLRVGSLQIADAMLHPGEFVEYDPASGAVQGLMGWPLMCEAQNRASAEAPA